MTMVTLCAQSSNKACVLVHNSYCAEYVNIIGASLSEPHTIVVYGSTCIDRPTGRSTDRPTDRPTDRVRPIHVILIRGARAHAAKPPCQTHVRHVNSAVRSGDSYKTENADDGKAKSRDTRATNCEAGTRETSEPLHTCASFSVSPCILGFHVRQFFSPVTSHKPLFTLSYISTTRAHWILDKTYRHVMHTGVHRPNPLA